MYSLKTNHFGLLRNCSQQEIDYCGIVVLNKSSFSLSIKIERGEYSDVYHRRCKKQL